MKRILYALLPAVALLMAACDKYDDSELRGEMNDLRSRVENLEALCSKINGNVSSIQTLLENINAKVAIDRVLTLENNEGYLITFSNGSSITVYNGLDGKDGVDGKDGKDGNDGKDGVDGKDGKDGTDGKDAEAPVIGVKAEESVLYWTLNGDWLLDAEGNKIPVVGEKGEKGDPGDPGLPGDDGDDGEDGEDGVTPQLKIENGAWMVSTDNGKTWSEVETDGSSTAPVAITITETEDGTAYDITVNDQTYTVAKAGAFLIKVDQDDLVFSGSSVTVTYTLTGEDETTHVVAEAVGVKAELDPDAKKLTISASETGSASGYVILRAIRNSDGAYSAQYIGVDGPVLQFSEAGEFNVGGKATTFDVKIKTNISYTVKDLPDWITDATTRAVKEETLTFSVAANGTGAERTGTFKIVGANDGPQLTVVVKQAVNNDGTGTLADPYTPAGAIEAVKDLTWTSNTVYDKTDKVYVKGKISRIASKGTYGESGDYGNASYWISADGTEKEEFQIFRSLYFNGEKYTSGTDIKVGDEVIVYGELMNYKGNTPETVSGKSYLYSLNGNTSGSGDTPGGDEPGGDEPGGDEPSGNSVSFSTNASAQSWAAASDGTYGALGFATTTQGLNIAYFKHTSTSSPVAPGTEVRVYKSSVLCISTTEGKKMKKIVIGCVPDSGSKSYCFDMAGLEGGADATCDKTTFTVTWTGSATKVVLQANNGQVRMEKLTVEFED